VSVTVNALQFTCDWCKAVSEERPLAPAGRYVDIPLPGGWSGAGYGTASNLAYYNVHLKDVYGSNVNHLCPACSARPVGELLTWLGREPEK
jgi:hypothetical protein